MTITFGFIDKIHNLLTNDEWIDSHNPKKRLEQFKSALETLRDAKQRVKLEKTINQLEKNISSDKESVLTLAKAQVSPNEGTELLANLHLLYNKDYNPRSCKTLEQLLRNNFSQLNSPNVYAKITKQVITPQSIPHEGKPVNKKLYDEVLPYCIIIRDLYTENGELNALVMAEKLSTYFKNLSDVKSYLKTINYDTKETIELSFQFNLPTDISHETLEFFQALNALVGRESLRLFSNAHLLERNDKFQEIIKTSKLSDNDFIKDIAKADDSQKKVQENLTNLIRDITDIAHQEVYQYNEQELSSENKLYAKNLAKFSFQGKLDNASFQKALDFIKEGNLKKSNNMPPINFDIEIKGKKYNFAALPANDMRGFLLGKFSNSCQSIGDNSEKCVLDGMNKPSAGFYIITDNKGKIRAQSYAWLAGEGGEKPTSLVLDSFEHLGKEDKQLFTPIMNKLKEELHKQDLNLYVGIGGQTPSITIEPVVHPLPIEKDFYIYGDSQKVYPITAELPELGSLQANMEFSNVQQFNSFEEVQEQNKLITAAILQKQKIEISQNIAYLINGGLSIGNIESLINNPASEKSKLFLTPVRNMNRLASSPINAKILFIEYDINPAKAKFFFAKANTFGQLAIDDKILFEEYDTNPEKVKLFLNYTYPRAKLIGCGILFKEYDKNPEKVKLYMDKIYDILTLTRDAGIEQERLFEECGTKPTKIQYLCQNIRAIKYLNRMDLMNGQILFEEYDRNPQKIAHFFKDYYNVADCKVELKKLFEEYDTNPEKVELFVTAGSDIAALVLDTNILFKEYDTNPDRIKLILKNAELLVTLVEHKIVTPESLLAASCEQISSFVQVATVRANQRKIAQKQEITSGFSAIKDAIFEGNTQLFKKLLQDHPIDINTKDTSGSTMLHFAIVYNRSQNEEIIKILLTQPKIDLSIKNSDDLTYQDLATRQGYHNIAKMIKSYQDLAQTEVPSHAQRIRSRSESPKPVGHFR
jgi:hypothetical protein